VLTVACVLRSGGIYNPNWVTRLRRQVDRHLSEPCRFVCFTDRDGLPCERIPLEHAWPGWWAKLELFRLPGPVLYLDLDTLVLGDLGDIAALARGRPFVMLRDFYQVTRRGSGVMAWSGDSSEIYEIFADAPLHWMEKSDRGDQGFIEQTALGAISALWQSELPGQIVSYKRDACDVAAPAGARLMCFHGAPKQCDLPPTHWARRLWDAA